MVGKFGGEIGQPAVQIDTRVEGHTGVVIDQTALAHQAGLGQGRQGDHQTRSESGEGHHPVRFFVDEGAHREAGVADLQNIAQGQSQARRQGPVDDCPVDTVAEGQSTVQRPGRRQRHRPDQGIGVSDRLQLDQRPAPVRVANARGHRPHIDDLGEGALCIGEIAGRRGHRHMDAAQVNIAAKQDPRVTIETGQNRARHRADGGDRRHP